jgi:hypothetical protein
MKNVKALSGLAVVVLGAMSAQAGIAPGGLTIPLGGGWEVFVTDPAHLGITPLNPNTALQDGAVHITKNASFTQIDPFTGAPGGLVLTFHQIAPDALTSPVIIIDNEVIQNLTGMGWTGFDQLLALSGAATFGANSLGMIVGPQFAGNTLSTDGRTFSSSGGPGVANGATWTPHGNSDFPGLVININLGAQDTLITFVLKEIPRVPTPGAAALLGAGAVLAGRRRR